MGIIGDYISKKQSVQYIFMSCNSITDKGIEILSDFIAGNTTLIVIGLDGNKNITDKAFPYLANMAKSTYIKRITVHNTSVSKEKRQELLHLLKSSNESREIPIKSNTKSAAKLS